MAEPGAVPFDGADGAAPTSLRATPAAPWARPLPLDDVFRDEEIDRTTLRGTLRLMRADVKLAGLYFGGAITHLYPNIFAALAHRVAHYLHQKGRRWSAAAVSVMCTTLTGAEIRAAAEIGPGLVLIHPVAVVIGSHVRTGRHLVLYGSNTLGWSVKRDGSGPGGQDGGSPTLGHDVVLFTHASVLGPVEVGNGVLVAAYALVIDDVPDNAAPRGVPARY